jgi:hypothetical protein
LREIYPPGRQLKLAGEIAAVITECLIGERHESYRVVWYSGNSRNEQWITSLEIDRLANMDDRKKVPIGFNREAPE